MITQAKGCRARGSSGHAQHGGAAGTSMVDWNQLATLPVSPALLKVRPLSEMAQVHALSLTFLRTLRACIRSLGTRQYYSIAGDLVCCAEKAARTGAGSARSRGAR